MTTAAAVASLLVTLSGCAGLDRFMKQAAQDSGRAAARVNLDRLPDDCRQTEAHAPLIEGQDPIIPLDIERDALDRQNARTLRCAAHDDARRERLK